MRPGVAMDKRPMRPGASAPMAWASARCGLGQAPYGLGKRPMRPRQAHCQQLGMRPVTLRRISQHPPVTSKLGLSSRLALPAHFHRQPGLLMCGLLIIIMCMCHTARNPQVPATGRQYRQRDETCRTLNDNLPHHHKETRTDKRSGMNS